MGRGGGILTSLGDTQEGHTQDVGSVVMERWEVEALELQEAPPTPEAKPHGFG